MYNLIVSAQSWGAHTGRILAERVFESTPKPFEVRFKPNGVLAAGEVRQYPTLLVEETENRATSPQMARIVTLTDITESRGVFHLKYAADPDIQLFSNGDLKRLAGDLGIGPTEFTRTHWAIKDADLFQVLFRYREARRHTPQVFKLPNIPIKDNLVGAMMPFSTDFKNVRAALQRAAKRANMTLTRVNDIWEHSTIIEDVVQLIATSRVVICDLSGKNANVLYETGIAHTLGKDVILITQNLEHVPFDLRHHRVITYHDNGDGRRDLVNSVADRLLALTAES